MAAWQYYNKRKRHISATHRRDSFFWLGNTVWLLPEKSNRDEVKGLLKATADAGYNVIQVQTINDVPAINVYGQKSHVDGWNFSDIDNSADYGYWDHMDFIIDEAAKRGIYVGMVCIWGGLVKSGKMNQEEAQKYGTFLAQRYKHCPNIIWIIGGDIKGDVKPEIWETLATTIKSIDPDHLMTFHPFGRTSSARWWHQADWLDMNMYQSGHRRYDQIRGDGDDRMAASVTEDNWRYVEEGLALSPRKPIIDGEPSYEDIPQGLHDINEPRWTGSDMRRYAYWSVFAGAAGHTYGHNSIMQMMHPGDEGAYGAEKAWYDAINDPGFNQMKYLKQLILSFPFYERKAAQNVLLGNDGIRYDRTIATCGNDYILAYTYTNQPISLDLSQISGREKDIWWFDPRTGEFEYVCRTDSQNFTIEHRGDKIPGNDWVLIAHDCANPYISISD